MFQSKLDPHQLGWKAFWRRSASACLLLCHRHGSLCPGFRQTCPTFVLTSAESHMVESWMFPPFKKESFHVCCASATKDDLLNQASPRPSTIPNLTNPPRRVEPKPPTVIVFGFSLFFSWNSSDDDEGHGWPRGRSASWSFAPSVHFNTAHTSRAPGWMVRGAPQALNPPPSRLTCGTFLLSPETLVEYTPGPTNYS